MTFSNVACDDLFTLRAVRPRPSGWGYKCASGERPAARTACDRRSDCRVAKETSGVKSIKARRCSNCKKKTSQPILQGSGAGYTYNCAFCEFHWVSLEQKLKFAAAGLVKKPYGLGGIMGRDSYA